MNKPALTLNDPLNLREFISAITDFIREAGPEEAQPKTIISFLALVLTGNDSDVSRKSTTVSTIQRCMSGNISYTAAPVKKLADEICSGARDAELEERLGIVVQSILSSPDNGERFFEGLTDQCGFRFFSKDERLLLRALQQEGNYIQLLLALLKHGFSTLYNLPCNFAVRMYEEAKTIDWDSPHRFKLLKLSADNGCREAAYDYANYLARTFRTQDSDADRYFLMAMPQKPEALWSLCNDVEIGWITPERLASWQASVRIDEKIASSAACMLHRDELEGIAYVKERDPDKAALWLWMYKCYFYVAYNSDFFKGFASMAKQLENGFIQVIGPDKSDTEAKTNALGLKYRQIAIRSCNVISLISQGTTRLQRFIAGEEREPGAEEEILEELRLAAEHDLLYGNFRLGEYYEYKNDVMKAKAYYLRALELDTDGTGRSGKLYLRLGMVSESPEEKRSYLEKALHAGTHDAAYWLADMEAKLYRSGSKGALLHLYEAIQLLQKYLPQISDAQRENAGFLLKALTAAAAEESKHLDSAKTV